jgi:hypothetical protein
MRMRVAGSASYYDGDWPFVNELLARKQRPNNKAARIKHNNQLHSFRFLLL